MRRINYDPILMGERILQKRKECNYSQELVAEKLNVSPNSISRYENGTRDGSEMNRDLLEMIMKYTPRQRAVVVNVLKNVNEAFHVGV
ncbi:helix-turn-helix domain-containing protein [Eubacterium sp.]|uniref:helix-turn-helix domain-containing protein n=1 Tax=Eubacterium sp. TaxID=142586 RepID=UPI00399F2B96